MDRVIFSSEDVNWLLAWRDQHKQEVRSSPSPMKSIQMEFPEVKRKVKCIREGNRLKLALNESERSIGYCELEVRINGCVLIKNKNLKEEEIQTMLTVYSSFMALLVYGTSSEREIPVDNLSKHREGTRSPSLTRKPKGISYVLKNLRPYTLGTLPIHHRSPRGIFSVRGHYRHYKNGKVVWINEYQKGEGSISKKIYKLGQNQGKT